MKNNKIQMSESIIVYILLALSGGSMDAYSYLYRGKVFANAQTGNILLMGVNIAEQRYEIALKYLWPILAFTLGIVISDFLRERKGNFHIHWRQIVVSIELIILIIVCFIPQNLNALANALTSLACGLQVQAFRSAVGNSIATTMCIGNLRSAASNMHRYFTSKEKMYFKKSILYFGTIFFFIIGAVVESRLITIYYGYALLFSVILLSISFLLMLIDAENS
ncbi:MAG: YoaK family protein [Eubacteriales bacterium]|nr:YoaK family protein [Eubacteriales bacterium]